MHINLWKKLKNINTHKSIFHLNKYQYTYNNNKNKNIKNTDTQSRDRCVPTSIINNTEDENINK